MNSPNPNAPMHRHPVPVRLDGAALRPQPRLVEWPGPDFGAIKTRQQATWASADFGQIGARLQIVGETLCEAADVLATDKVLDVAAGNGNASLAAARRFAEVTSTDYVPALLESGRRRAEADQLDITFEVADAEALPYAGGSFDVVLSTFGVMFAPHQERAAAELLRVTKPGGRIGLASWTPDSFVGRLFEVVSAFVPPPAGLRSPMEWGTETRLVELFGPDVSDIRVKRTAYQFRYRSAEHWIYFFRAYYGPTQRAFAALGEAHQALLHTALLELLEKWNRPNTSALVIPGDYLEVVLAK